MSAHTAEETLSVKERPEGWCGGSVASEWQGAGLKAGDVAGPEPVGLSRS